MKEVGITAGVVISIYMLIAIYLFLYQRDFLYFPSPPIAHQFNVEEFSIDNESIHVVVLNSGHNKAIIYFGGNAEAVAERAPEFKKNFPEHTLYLVNYRGYGGSSGYPAEQALYADAQFIYDKVVVRHQLISVIGRSLGTGVATMLASTRAIHKMALITPYDSIENIAQDRYPIYPIFILLNDKFDSASRVKDIDSQTLIILAENDVIVPYKRSAELIKTFPSSQVRVEIIKNADHITLSHKDRYYSLLSEFM